jgi:hypothetical protein
MRHRSLATRAGRTMIIGIVITAAVSGAAAAAAAAGSGHAAAGSGAPCVKVHVTARPKLNTQAGSTETLQTTLKSCSSKFEVVNLKQQLSIRGKFDGTVQLYRHEQVEITQQIPFRCCGAFSVTDRAFSQSGKLLGKAKATWTFA